MKFGRKMKRVLGNCTIRRARGVGMQYNVTKL